ncbi:hypothetical protein SO694_00004448 [Aureococcus anophagefferens]|uniref:Uncharacterized protein n=1 Tax=Aureococcus anophagefferens TaxID=44056 RepID=A0ABR1G9E5_AURAN
MGLLREFAFKTRMGVDAPASLWRGFTRRAPRPVPAIALHTQVLCSIHQPRSAVWLLLDTAYFLSRGRLVSRWSGRRARSTGSATLGYAGRTFEGNAADFVLDLTAVDFDKAPEVFGKKTMRSDDDVARALDALERGAPEALIGAAVRRRCRRRRGRPTPSSAACSPGASRSAICGTPATSGA